MLIKKIENGLQVANYPVRDIEVIKPGMIVQNYVIDDSLVLDVSDGSCPFGIVSCCVNKNSINIYYQSDIFLTDIYDLDYRYPVNAALFCSEKGIITTKQNHSNQRGIGFVIKQPIQGNFLEFLLRL
jgi:hypothetical protein